MSLNYRTLWISDVHLGTSAARAADLLEFLTNVHADKIFLVGDIIDLERMQVRPQFPDMHRQLVSQLIHLGNTRSEVVFIPGNHDYPFRDLAGQNLCGIPIKLEAEHTTDCGRRLLVIHGDVLDFKPLDRIILLILWSQGPATLRDLANPAPFSRDSLKNLAYL